MKLLLIGDEQKNRRLLAFGLANGSMDVAHVSTPEDFERLSSPTDFHAALLDWDMRKAPALLMLLREASTELPVVAAVASAAGAAAARKAGATECITKPFEIETLKTMLQRYAAFSLPTVPEPAALPAVEAPVVEFASKSPLMQRVLDVAWRVAPTPANVLVLGESGTGKTMLARGIHERSQRSRHPFVTVNCPCLQPQLLESELFGHVRGSFTGAVSDAAGKVAAAHGGTLFLDEVGELPLAIQPKLLRLIQDRQYERVGECKSRFADIRVIAATNRDLKREVEAGRFREDLYYRLNVVTLDVLPLRHRPEDIVLAAEGFLTSMAATLGKPMRGFTLLAREALQAHSWPGNLRELRNAVERAAILCDRDLLDVSDFPELVAQPDANSPRVGDFVSLETLEEEHIRQVVARAASFEHAARILGIDKSTLYRRRKRTEARVSDFSAEASDSVCASAS